MEEQHGGPAFPLSASDFQPEQAMADEMDQEHDQQLHMDPELHHSQQQQEHLPPSMAEALDQQNLDEQHLRHAEGLLSFANENVGNEYYTSQTDNLSRMLEAQTVDTLGAEGGNDMENGPRHDDDGGGGGGVQLDENGYPLDSGLNGALYGNSQDAQHAAMMAAAAAAGDHGAHMGMEGVDGMHEDYHSAASGGSSRMGMDSSRKRKRITKETIPAEAVKLKKDVHKEVERKRRAVINEGVAAIAAVLPTNEKQKGLILAHAAQYIRQLQENERINTNSWAEEKGMLEQDIADLRVRLVGLVGRAAFDSSQLQHTQARLEQEHAHFERIDLAWREAEDRAAALQAELDDIRRRVVLPAGGGDSRGISGGEEDEEGEHGGGGGGVDLDQEHVDDTMDDNDEFAIEATTTTAATVTAETEAVGEEGHGGEPEHGEHDGGDPGEHDDQAAGYVSEPGDHEVLAA
ncbi:hypothetical protein QFC19_000765 [Naganishia cerealis]|uniref:Uncharacterized protein n=1 Tax=Naganishia cerealis TaxID=610337 RepID=A0ACC2WKU8_9TREE|nr:hypothetical protein QFC19_000765 [Naganishia cerealis]